ncbi:MAG TPA: DUF2017 family protein [Actinomycetota bacterium]|nr:DUF2017 family protein [Actinomycetota bacterium]
MAGPVRRSRRGGGFDIRISGRERDVLATVPETLRAVLASGDAGDPVARRLFPSAYLDDEAASREFDDVVRDDLMERRLEAIATFERTVRADHVTEDELIDWLAALNDVRLVLGVRLAVTEESTSEDFAGEDETETAFELYRYLSYLEENVVEALSA